MVTFTDDEFTDWLAAPDAVRVTLAIMEHSNGTVYFGTYGYTSTPSDADPNRHFEDLLLDKVKIVEAVDKTTLGEIVVVNDATHDDWLEFNWLGFPLKVYLGDVRWSLDNFRLIIDGRNGGISAPATNRYKFSILDPHEELRIELGAEFAPLCFGETYNIRPVLIDAGTLKYKYDDGPVTGIVVRDNGIVLTDPAGYSADLTNGELTLVSAPAGQITVDVSEANAEAHEIIEAICQLVPVANENDRIWDIDDAALNEDYDTNTTAFTTSGGGEVLTVSVSDSQYYIGVESNTTPTAGARVSIPITTLSTVNPSNGDLVFVRGKVRHVGTGDDWILVVASDAALTSDVTTIDTLSNTDTTWQNFSYVFTFSTVAGELDHFGVIESNGANSGGMELDDIEFFHAGVPVNTTNMAALTNTDNLGLYVQAPISAGDLIRSIMETVGGSFRFNTTGELEIFLIELPGTSVLTITPDDIFSIETSGIKHLGSERPIKFYELGYQKNWNVQSADSLAGAVSIQDREDMSKEFRYVNKANSLSNFPLAKDRRIGTLFELEADAQTEVDRRQVIRSDKRDSFFVKSFLAPGQISIGQTITVDYPDYGFDGGVDVVVLETHRLLGKNRIDLVVWN